MVNILGLGFTGRRLALRLLRRGEKVFAAARHPERFNHLSDAGLILEELRLGTPGAPALPKCGTLVHLIPPLEVAENAALRRVIQELQPKRVVYISSTGVYGDQVVVDTETSVAPNDERGRRRLDEETWVAAGPWESLILRAAAIYGPGRGVHVALREGRLPRSASSGIVSRVHVDDLAALIEAGIYSGLRGAWPVADDEPSSSADIGAGCAQLLKIEAVQEIRPDPATRGRRVNGKKLREILGIELIYPSWRTGIPASLAEEGWGTGLYLSGERRS